MAKIQITLDQKLGRMSANSVVVETTTAAQGSDTTPTESLYPTLMPEGVNVHAFRFPNGNIRVVFRCKEANPSLLINGSTHHLFSSYASEHSADKTYFFDAEPGAKATLEMDGTAHIFVVPDTKRGLRCAWTDGNMIGGCFCEGAEEFEERIGVLICRTCGLATHQECGMSAETCPNEHKITEYELETSWPIVGEGIRMLPPVGCRNAAEKREKFGPYAPAKRLQKGKSLFGPAAQSAAQAAATQPPFEFGAVEFGTAQPRAPFTFAMPARTSTSAEPSPFTFGMSENGRRRREFRGRRGEAATDAAGAAATAEKEYIERMLTAINNLRAKRARLAEVEHPDAIVERLKMLVIAEVDRHARGNNFSDEMSVNVPLSVVSRIEQFLWPGVFTYKIAGTVNTTTNTQRVEFELVNTKEE